MNDQTIEFLFENLKSGASGFLRCMTFRSPGPPWYAARCRKTLDHEGDCEFGTIEDAERGFRNCKIGGWPPDIKKTAFIDFLHEKLLEDATAYRERLNAALHDLSLVESVIKAPENTPTNL